MHIAGQFKCFYFCRARNGGRGIIRMEYFRITLFSESGISPNRILQKGIINNEIFPKESFRKYF
jgi:hypothetical protein